MGKDVHLITSIPLCKCCCPFQKTRKSQQRSGRESSVISLAELTTVSLLVRFFQNHLNHMSVCMFMHVCVYSHHGGHVYV